MTLTPPLPQAGEGVTATAAGLRVTLKWPALPLAGSGRDLCAGATAAAATSIVTAPYYAGVAAVDAGGKVVDYAKENLTLNPSEIDWDRTLKPWKWF